MALDPATAAASPPPGTPVKISAGAETNCALMSSGAVYCWGSNDAGKLGAGSSTDASVTPLKVTGLSAVTDVHINANHACALQGGKAFCWGDGQAGKLGSGATSPQGNDASTPQAVVGLSGVTSIATGNNNTCATAAGKQFCWGSNDHSQLGTDQVEGFLRRTGAGHRRDAAAAAGRRPSSPRLSSSRRRRWRRK